MRGALAEYIKISIHALREEGDIAVDDVTAGMTEFLSTPSARRATESLVCLVRTGVEFLSTPSARRATIAATARETIHGDFYPRPPRGGRREHGAARRAGG